MNALIMTKKFLIETFGCRTNQYEAQLLREELLQAAFEESSQEVDVCLIHSCSVTLQAEKSCKNKVRTLCKKFPKARIIVSGCFAKREPLALCAIDSRVEVIADRKKILLALSGKESCCEKKGISFFQGHTRAFVKVQEGCSAFCSYCIIPKLRGPSSSRTIEEIVAEVEALAQNGYQEIVLTGVNIGEYRYGLVELVKAMDAIEKVKRLRISSIEPNHVEEDLIETLLKGRSTMPHLHLVLQSGSDDLLKKMRRPYTKEIFVEKVASIRKRRKDFCFTTDVIVGFPTETENDFHQTAHLLEKIGFAKVHIFPYSKRPQTLAERMEGHLSSQEITKRKEILFQMAERVAFQEREKFLRQKVPILLEGKGEGGFSPHMLPVCLERPLGYANEIVWVDLIENQKDHLIGKIL
jgi:threonylcarbamoyladenosine tRNA methylthiotransferase MtaB